MRVSPHIVVGVKELNACVRPHSLTHSPACLSVHPLAYEWDDLRKCDFTISAHSYTHTQTRARALKAAAHYHYVHECMFHNK